MFLDSEPEGEIQLPRSGMPLKEKKRTATLLTATEKIYMFLSSSPSVTKGKPFFFSSVKGSVHSQALTCKSSFDMLICACNTAFILSRNYMHAWHAVPSCKWNKDEKTPMQGDRWISVIGASIARPRERSEIGGAAKIGNLSCLHWVFFILFLKWQTRIYWQVNGLYIK